MIEAEGVERRHFRALFRFDPSDRLEVKYHPYCKYNDQQDMSGDCQRDLYVSHGGVPLVFFESQCAENTENHDTCEADSH